MRPSGIGFLITTDCFTNFSIFFFTIFSKQTTLGEMLNILPLAMSCRPSMIFTISTAFYYYYGNIDLGHYNFYLLT